MSFAHKRTRTCTENARETHVLNYVVISSSYTYELVLSHNLCACVCVMFDAFVMISAIADFRFAQNAHVCVCCVRM